jgi:hypothetical protein
VAGHPSAQKDLGGHGQSAEPGGDQDRPVGVLHELLVLRLRVNRGVVAPVIFLTDRLDRG